MQHANSSEKIWTKSFISLALTQFIFFTVFYSLMTTLPIYVIEDLNESESKAGLIVTFMLASSILIVLKFSIFLKRRKHFLSVLSCSR